MGPARDKTRATLSRPMNEAPSSHALRGFTVGFCTTLGWSLYDLVKLTSSGDPSPVLELLLPHAIACVAGGLLGSLLIAHAFSFVVGVVLLAIATRSTGALPADMRGLPSAALYLALAMVSGFATVRIAKGKRIQPEMVGLALGTLACAFLSYRRTGPRLTIEPLITAALLTLVLACVPRLRWRLLGGVALVPLALYSSFARYERWMEDVREVPAPEVTAADGPNVLLIILDTVRADRLAPYGYGRETTPRLDRFVREHAGVYTNMRSASSWTLPSHASLFTGLPPSKHGATHVRIARSKEELVRPSLASALDPSVITIAEKLGQAGYATGAIFANHAFLSAGYGLDRGFQHHDARKGAWLGTHRTLVQHAGFALRAGHVPTRDGSWITAAALDWLARERGGKPYFLAVNYMDAHSPYVPPAHYDDLFEARRPADPLAPPREDHGLLYDRLLRHLDDQLTPLLDWVERAPEFEDTLVIVTSDHGEAFGEQGYWEHDWTLYESMVRVPLYVKPPGGRARETYSEGFSLRDVHNLILSTVGLAESSAPLGWLGEWFHDPDRGRIKVEDYVRPEHVYRDLYGWIDGDEKFLVASDGTVEVFDLASDPGEQHPITPTPEKAAAALARARSWWADNPPRNTAVEVDEETMEGLRALGYAGRE